MERRKIMIPIPAARLTSPPILMPSRALMRLMRSFFAHELQSCLGTLAGTLGQAVHSVRLVEGLAFLAAAVDPAHQGNENDKQRDSPDRQKHPQTMPCENGSPG